MTSTTGHVRTHMTTAMLRDELRFAHADVRSEVADALEVVAQAMAAVGVNELTRDDIAELADTL